MTTNNLPVVIIGAGAVGLAAAAHLLERGETPLIFEQGAQVGASIAEWAHVRMFSPWQYTVDSASVRLLEKHGWQMPSIDVPPTGGELCTEYLLPLAQTPEISPHLHLNARVTAVSRQNIDKMKDAQRDTTPFVVRVAYGDGREAIFYARAVIDAAGTWQTPNPLGADGLPAVGEARSIAHVAYGIPDVIGTERTRYANRRVMVVGSGHSAINALLSLADLQQDAPQTQLYWVMRSNNLQRVYGGGEQDALEARGKLGMRIKALVERGQLTILAPFRIQEVAQTAEGVCVHAETPNGTQAVTVDEIITATGARPDFTYLRELRLSIDPALESVSTIAEMIDPNIHSCGTVRPHGESSLRHAEKDFYIVGMKSYGRAPTFLLATGYEQVRSIAAALAGDLASARAIEFSLPETGVCSSQFDDAGGCCAVPTGTTLSLGAIQINN